MNIKTGIFILATMLGTFSTGISQPLTKETALIIIDVQDFYFPGGNSELVSPEAASENIARLLSLFRSRQLPVIHVRHNYQPGGDFHRNVMPQEGEMVISKDHANSFRDTDLQGYILEMGISELVITGMQTHMCVEATTRAAADYGLKCLVISDGCATRDLKFGDIVIKSEDVHYSTLSTLKGTYAEVIRTQEFMAKYGGKPE